MERNVLFERAWAMMTTRQKLDFGVNDAKQYFESVRIPRAEFILGGQLIATHPMLYEQLKVGGIVYLDQLSYVVKGIANTAECQSIYVERSL